METPVEIRYAGVVVARANEVRRMTVGGVDMFLAMPEPLPAGTVVSLNNDTQARIEKVIESVDPSVAGVYVRLLGEGEASQPWVPTFRESEVPAPRPPAVVVSPVIVRPVHIPRTIPVADPPRPEPPRPEPVAVQPEPIAAHPETPEVVAVVPEPRPFVSAMPTPDEQVAHFDAPLPPPAPPPEAVVERAVTRERSKRSTIVMAIPPPPEPGREEDGRPSGAVNRAVGEIDTGSRRIKTGQAEVQSASIMVESDPLDSATVPAPAAVAPESPPPAEHHDQAKQEELRLEELSTARPLPSAKGRAGSRRRRNTTQR